MYLYSIFYIVTSNIVKCFYTLNYVSKLNEEHYTVYYNISFYIISILYDDVFFISTANMGRKSV